MKQATLKEKKKKEEQEKEEERNKLHYLPGP